MCLLSSSVEFVLVPGNVNVCNLAGTSDFIKGDELSGVDKKVIGGGRAYGVTVDHLKPISFGVLLTYQAV